MWDKLSFYAPVTVIIGVPIFFGYLYLVAPPFKT